MAWANSNWEGEQLLLLMEDSMRNSPIISDFFGAAHTAQAVRTLASHEGQNMPKVKSHSGKGGKGPR